MSESSSAPTPEALDPQRDDTGARQSEIDATLRAIGRYVVRFSQLVYAMRVTMSARLTADHDPIELGEIMLAQAEAQRIADSFFAMCRFEGRLDDVGKNVAGVLQNQVTEAIKQRNVFAHGDWWVGLLGAPGDNGPTPAELVNMYPRRRTGSPADLTTHPSDSLESLCVAMGDLIQDIWEFAALALGLPVTLVERDKGLLASVRGSVAVSDVFTVTPGKGGKDPHPAGVKRNGPRASDVIRVQAYLP